MFAHKLRIAEGLAGVSLLAVMTIALITGQARANLHESASAAARLSTSTKASLILTRERLRELESLPQIIDTVLALPIFIEIRLQDLPANAGEEVEKHEAR